MGHLKDLMETGSGELISFYHFTDTPYVDVSDQLNWQVTVNLLTVLVLVLANIRLFLNKTISCAVPIYFSENQETYANEMCYVSESKYAANESNTILIAPNQTLVYYFKKKSSSSTSSPLSPLRPASDEPTPTPTPPPASPRQLGSYYVWVPYALITLILLFLLVKCLWIYVLRCRFRDMDLNEMLKAAARLKEFPPLDEFVSFRSAHHIDVNQLVYRNSNMK